MCAFAANNSWHNVQNDLDWFVERSDAKKIYFTQVWTGCFLL